MAPGRASTRWALLLLLAACGKEPPPAGPAPTAPRPSGGAQGSAAPPEGATPTATDDDEEAREREAAEAEFASYTDRRKRRPSVIGGCAERCQTPELAMDLLIERLRDRDRVAGLRELFDWSLLVADGEPLGRRWAEMWGSTVGQPKREAEIKAWLERWSAFVEGIQRPEDLDRSRATGLSLKPFDGRTDVYVVTWRHPKLNPPRGEDVWRFDLTRRGWEWLISRVDHRPSSTPRRAPPPRGSAAPGRL